MMVSEPSRFDDHDLPEWVSELPRDDKTRMYYEENLRMFDHHRAPRANRRVHRSKPSLLPYVAGGILIPFLGALLLGIIGVGVVTFTAGAVLFAGLLQGVGDSRDEISPGGMVASAIALFIGAFLIFAATS